MNPSPPANQPLVAFGVVHIDDYSLVLDLDKLRRWAVSPDHGIRARVGGQLQQLSEDLPSEEHRMSPATLICGDHDRSAALAESCHNASHCSCADGGMIHQTEDDGFDVISNQGSQTHL